MRSKNPNSQFKKKEMRKNYLPPCKGLLDYSKVPFDDNPKSINIADTKYFHYSIFKLKIDPTVTARSVSGSKVFCHSSHPKIRFKNFQSQRHTIFHITRDKVTLNVTDRREFYVIEQIKRCTGYCDSKNPPCGNKKCEAKMFVLMKPDTEKGDYVDTNYIREFVAHGSPPASKNTKNTRKIPIPKIKTYLKPLFVFPKSGDVRGGDVVRVFTKIVTPFSMAPNQQFNVEFGNNVSKAFSYHPKFANIGKIALDKELAKLWRLADSELVVYTPPRSQPGVVSIGISVYIYKAPKWYRMAMGSESELFEYVDEVELKKKEEEMKLEMKRNSESSFEYSPDDVLPFENIMMDDEVGDPVVSPLFDEEQGFDEGFGTNEFDYKLHDHRRNVFKQDVVMHMMSLEDTGDDEIIKIFKNEKINVKFVDNFGNTYLYWSNFFGRKNVVEFLLNKTDVNPEQKNSYGLVYTDWTSDTDLSDIFIDSESYREQSQPIVVPGKKNILPTLKVVKERNKIQEGFFLKIGDVDPREVIVEWKHFDRKMVTQPISDTVVFSGADYKNLGLQNSKISNPDSNAFIVYSMLEVNRYTDGALSVKVGEMADPEKVFEMKSSGPEPVEEIVKGDKSITMESDGKHLDNFNDSDFSSEKMSVTFRGFNSIQKANHACRFRRNDEKNVLWLWRFTYNRGEMNREDFSLNEYEKVKEKSGVLKKLKSFTEKFTKKKKEIVISNQNDGSKKKKKKRKKNKIVLVNRKDTSQKIEFRFDEENSFSKLDLVLDKYSLRRSLVVNSSGISDTRTGEKRRNEEDESDKIDDSVKIVNTVTWNELKKYFRSWNQDPEFLKFVENAESTSDNDFEIVHYFTYHFEDLLKKKEKGNVRKLMERLKLAREELKNRKFYEKPIGLWTFENVQNWCDLIFAHRNRNTFSDVVFLGKEVKTTIDKMSKQVAEMKTGSCPFKTFMSALDEDVKDLFPRELKDLGVSLKDSKKLLEYALYPRLRLMIESCSNFLKGLMKVSDEQSFEKFIDEPEGSLIKPIADVVNEVMSKFMQKRKTGVDQTSINTLARNIRTEISKKCRKLIKTNVEELCSICDILDDPDIVHLRVNLNCMYRRSSVTTSQKFGYAFKSAILNTPKIGYFHAGVSVRDIMFDFKSDGLVHVEQIGSASHCVGSFGVDEFVILLDGIPKIVDFVINYRNDKLYDMKSNNCQDFYVSFFKFLYENFDSTSRRKQGDFYGKEVKDWFDEMMKINTESDEQKIERFREEVKVHHTELWEEIKDYGSGDVYKKDEYSVIFRDTFYPKKIVQISDEFKETFPDVWDMIEEGIVPTVFRKIDDTEKFMVLFDTQEKYEMLCEKFRFLVILIKAFNRSFFVNGERDPKKNNYFNVVLGSMDENHKGIKLKGVM